MKKFYLFILLATSLSLQAQTMLVNDFESGLGGAYVAWGGSCELINNPMKDASNSSNSVMKITSEDYAPVGFPVNLPTGKTLKDYTGVRFQAMILEGSSNIHWIGFNVGVSESNNTMDLVDPTAGNGAAWGEGIINKWVDVELMFNDLLLAQFSDTYTSGNYNVMIKLGRKAFIYAVDNVRLIEKEVVAHPNTIFTFETMDLGTTTRCGMPWSGSCSIVQNSVATGINNSNKCLEVQGGEFSPVTFSGALPNGKTWSDFNGLSFQMCVVNDPDTRRNWGGCEVGVRLDDGSHIKIGAAYDGEGNETAAFGDVPLSEWININLSIKENLITEPANTAGTLYLRVMKSNLTYYIDNIVLSPKGPVNGIEEQRGNEAVKVIGLSRKIRLDVMKQSNISVYGIDARLIDSNTYIPGIYEFELPSGIYIVNKQKVVIY